MESGIISKTAVKQYLSCTVKAFCNCFRNMGIAADGKEEQILPATVPAEIHHQNILLEANGADLSGLLHQFKGLLLILLKHIREYHRGIGMVLPDIFRQSHGAIVQIAEDVNIPEENAQVPQIRCQIPEQGQDEAEGKHRCQHIQGGAPRRIQGNESFRAGRHIFGDLSKLAACGKHLNGETYKEK